MPRARLPVTALNMFASLVPPRTLLDVREQNIFQEALTRLAVPTSDGQVLSTSSPDPSRTTPKPEALTLVRADMEQCAAPRDDRLSVKVDLLLREA